MERKIYLRRSFLIPAVAVLSLFASLVTPMESAFAAAPTVTGFSPTSGGNGTRVVITGTNFSGSGSCTVNRVRFGGTNAASYVVDSATQLTATVGAGTTGVVDVRTNGSGCGTGTSSGSFTWTATTYTMTYDGNGNSGGTVPVDGTTPYAGGSTVTVLGNTGSLTKIGYVFANWNTAANGSGTSYSGGNTFTINAGTTLYAQWTAMYTVTYNGNGNTGGNVPVDGSSPYASGSTVTVLGNTGSLVKTGNTFSNWNTAANGSGTSYAPTNTFTISSNTVLYAQWRASITYNANGATGGTVPVDASSPYLTGTTITVLGNTGSLVKTDYNFASWNTAANGSGTTYTAGNTFALNADTVLYAQWSVITYTVTYDGNGNTGGSPPTDGSSPYASGSLVTVLGNTGSLVKTGYSFSNWNTAANGSGTSYASSATFNIGANTTLYAQWTSTFTVIYNGNTNSGGTVPVDGSSPYLGGALVTVLGNTGSLVKTGNTFAGWNTSANGLGTAYAPSSTFNIAANTVLYAQWTATITYNANGATGGAVPSDASSPYRSGTTITVLGNTGSLVKTDYNFTGWNTAANGSGTSYAPGNTFALNADTVLYAQWSVITRTLTYNGNGNTGGTVPVDGSSPYATGSLVTALGNTGSLVKTGYLFSSWNTAANGSGTTYAPAATFTINADTVLYAQWAISYTVTYDEDGATGGTVPVDSSSPYLSDATVTVLGNTGSLVKTGGTFVRWNTQLNGSGTDYLPGATFTITSNVVLYPQWSHTLTYSANDATSGTVPVDVNSPYMHGFTVTVLGNTGSLVKTGNTFSNWNTAVNGSGTSYSAGNTFAITTDTVLYAQWKASVTYNGNGNTGGTAPTDGSSPYLDGATVTVLGNTGSLVKTGYVFSHWNTAANGSGASYSPTNTFMISADTVLYAQWTITYTVTYAGNGSTAGTVPTDSSSPYALNSIVTVLGNTGSLVRTGNTFANWNTTADGSGTPYSSGSTFSINANTVLYAQWRTTVTYDANGATGGSVPVDGSSPYLNGTTVTVLGNTGSLVKTGNTFANWNTAANGSGTPYLSGNTFSISANTILYAQWTPITYTVTYDGNGNTGGTAPVDGSSPYLANATVTVLGNTGSLVKTDYVFDHWNTAANGSGTSYTPTSTFSIGANTILYAQWTVTYTVTYLPNGATGGGVPVDGSSPYANGLNVTVLGNTGSLVRTGNTFANWNTAANGSGTSYAPSDVFTIGANTILYAQWRASVTYNANGATGGTVPVDALSPYLNGATVTILGNTGSLVRTGNTFANWNTAANGTGTTYQASNTFSIGANTVLYAQWRAGVTYNGNGNTGGSAPTDASSPYLNGATVTVLGNTGSLVKTGYTFDQWNTAANGSGTSYSPTNTFTVTSDTVLYAQWTLTYTVTYMPNGATGGSVPVDASSPYVASSTVTILGNTGSLVRTGNTFANWNTAANGSGTSYSPADTFTINANIVLYAQWRASVTYNGNGNTGGTAPTDVSSPYLNGATVTILGNTGSMVRTGNTFANWNTSSNGTGIAYTAGNTFTISADTVLYAQWRASVTYSGNGNTGGTAPTDSSSPYLNGATVTVLGNTGSLAKTGYVFDHWNTAANGSGTSYSPTNTFTLSADTILYAQWNAIYIVAYDPNGSTGGTVPVDGSSPYLTGATVTVLGNTGTLVRTGNTFANWNTAANGSGTTYSAGNTFTVDANTVLYAQWRASITYNANGATGGSVPVDGSSPYLNGSTVTVLGNTGSLIRTGYAFVRWNTAANGSGTYYSAADTFGITAETILYAQWTITYTVNYEGNGSTGGSVPVDSSSPYINGANVTVLGNTGSLVKTGYTFTNWNTAANGSGFSHSPSDVFSIGANTVLYAQWTPISTYSVTYNGNGSTGGSAPTDSSSPYFDGSTVTVLGNTGPLVRTGYAFANWNTAANGSGTSYSAGNTFDIHAGTVLYAQWTLLTTYSVTYNGNGNTGGTAPTDGSSPYLTDATVTVLGNSGLLVKTGYVFNRWNTAANGSGTNYSPTNTFTISANTTLYAQWTVTYTVTYNGNGSTGGSVPTDSSSPYSTGSTITVLGNTGSLVKTGNTFGGWNTLANGTGTAYNSGDTFSIGANINLYAQWRAAVSYEENGSTGGTVPTDLSSPYLNGATVTVLGNTGSLVKTGNTFANWNTAANGTGFSYAGGDTFSVTADTVLYAQWTPITYTVTYNGNGNTGGSVPVDSSSPYLHDSTVTALGNTGSLVKSGYVFAHWNTAANGSGTNYSPGNTFTLASNMILYAQWTITYTVTYDADGATGGTAPVDSSSPYSNGATVTVLGNTGNLTRTGNTFSDWNTAYDGSGTPYTPGTTFTIGSNVTLYAQWHSTIVYDSNGATGGSVPVDTNSPYEFGSAVTVLGNTGLLVKSGRTFANWNTAANGSGIAYGPGNTFTASANTVLYAQWTVTISYNGNGNTSGIVPIDALSPYLENATVTVLGNTGTLARTGYVFSNWNTASNGSGASYSPTNTFTLASNTILYAQWTRSFSVIYDEDGATGGSIPIDSSSPYVTGSTVTVLGNTGSLVRVGNTFSGWNTIENGTGTNYDVGATFTISSDVILYAQWHATVTYNANGATSGSVPVDIASPYENGSAVTVLGNTGTLVKTGYTFTAWNTTANGAGISYSAGNVFSIPGDTILYAQWTPITYTVTYNGNGNSGGLVPVDSSSPYVGSATVTVLGNSGSLVKTGYIFDHWNTAVNNSGTNYAPSATFSIGANTTLYAQWVAEYTVTYDADGATGGSVPVDPSSPYVTGSTVTVLGNTGSLTRTGNTFSGWNTAANGTGTAYAPGSTFTITTNVTLFAQWHASITYNANGATGGTVPVDASSPYENGWTVTVLGNSGSLVRAGFTFANWNTAANGSGVSYAPSDAFSIAANTILYAQWTLVGTYSLSYNANGATSGSTPVDPLSPYGIGSTVTVLGNTGSLARIGHLFINWNTAANGSGTSYSPSATFTINENTILYAQWSTTYVVIYDEDGATGGTVPVDPSSPYLTGSSVTILGNTGSLVKTGSIFLRWNTVEDGSGTAYTPGTVMTISANLVLYVQWSSTITYAANGATGGTVPVDASSPYVVGTTVVVLGNIGTLTKTGNIFSHWNTAANGSGISYYPSDSFTVATNTVLYAQWVATVTYNGNGATSGSVPVDSSSPYAVGSTVTVKSNSGSLMKIGTTFSNWNTAADGSGNSYSPSATFTLLVSTTLYAQWTGTHTLLYDNDGATGGAIPVDPSSPYADGATVTILGNTGSLVKTANSFAGWNTVENGTGTHYSPGDTFTIRGDTTLFAQWTATVTYHANGATGGTAPTDASSPYPTPFGGTTTVTVLGNTGSLVRTGNTFASWNTAADGSGTIYRAGDTFTLSGNVDLYAQWGAIHFTVTYNGNGSTSGTIPLDSSSPYDESATVTVKSNSGSLARVGYGFVNWNSAANGSGTSYAPGATFTIEGNTVLYAQWTGSYTVTYDQGGATGGVAPMDSSGPYLNGSIVTVLGNTGSLARTGNTFAGWNTAPDGSGTTYAPGATFEIHSNTILTALWTATATYNANGATGGTVPIDSSSPYTNSFPSQTVVSVLANTGSLVRTGYNFVHWSTSPDLGGEQFAPGDQFVIERNTVLYADWVLIGYSEVEYNDNGSTSGSVPIDASSPYANGTTVTVLGNTGSLAKTGSVFEGWNTESDGTGIVYRPNDQLVINSTVILYAEWELHVYTVSYEGNGSTSGTAPVDSRNPYDIGDLVTILANTGALARTGYTFAGWNTSADGSGTTYDATRTETFVISSDTTFYAIWTANHTVTFNANGGSGSMSPQTSSNQAALTSNSFRRSGYVFNGWNTAVNGSGAGYADSSAYPFSSDLTLYAQWTQSAQPYVPPAITSPVATIQSPVSELVDNDETSETVVEAALELSGGGKVEVEVVVPPGAITASVTISITPAAPAGGLVAGTVAIKVTATDASGNLVTHFDKPLAVNLGYVSPTGIPMFSEDGINWMPVPRISGTVLPENMAEGYYVDSSGHTIILTRHLTYFGVKKLQRSLVATPLTTTIEAGKHTRIIATGGSGRGIRNFLTSTPNVCTVSKGGLLTGLSAGICTFAAIRNGDAIYASATSSPNNVTITKTAQRTLWLTSTVKSFAIGKVATLKVYGGSGTGVLTFKSNSPSICSVSAQGEVVGLNAGRCGLSATKAGDNTYHPYSSDILYLEIIKSMAVKK